MKIDGDVEMIMRILHCNYLFNFYLCYQALLISNIEGRTNPDPKKHHTMWGNGLSATYAAARYICSRL